MTRKRKEIERRIKRIDKDYCDNICQSENCKNCDREFLTVDDVLSIKGDADCHSKRNGD